jgi:hypothetical protein
VVGSLVICPSVVVHGLTATPLTKLYGDFTEDRPKSNKVLGRPNVSRASLARVGFGALATSRDQLSQGCLSEKGSVCRHGY